MSTDTRPSDELDETLALRPVCVMQVDFRRVALPTGTGPFGHRSLMPVTGGDVDGERFVGDVLNVGDLLVLRGDDEWASVELRCVIRLVDGTEMWVRGEGVVEINDAVRRAEGEGRPTAFADQRFHLTLRMETGASRHTWVNRTLFVAAARVNPRHGRGLEVRVDAVR